MLATHPLASGRPGSAWRAVPLSAGVSLLINSGTAHAVEMAREGVPLIVIQHQLGHS
jgi:hypothetical protein